MCKTRQKEAESPIFHKKRHAAEAACLKLFSECFVEAKLLITGPTTGAVYLEFEDPRVNLEPVEKVNKGDRVSFKVPCKVRPSDKLYKIVKTEHGCCD